MQRPETYPGTYLKTKPFEKRYQIVADFLKKKFKTVVDLNCGEPLFKNYIQYDRYVANDIYVPDDTSGIEFIHDTDTKVDVKPDLLCIFGYGGAEHTGNELESKTASDSIVWLAQYKPEYIVVEMAQKWEEDFKIMTNLYKRLPNYTVVFTQKIIIEPANHYHDKRVITILCLV